MTPNKVTFSAAVASVKTLADGGLRVAFDLPEQDIMPAAVLMQCKADGIPLRVEVTADLPAVSGQTTTSFKTT